MIPGRQTEMLLLRPTAAAAAVRESCRRKMVEKEANAGNGCGN